MPHYFSKTLCFKDNICSLIATLLPKRLVLWTGLRMLCFYTQAHERAGSKLPEIDTIKIADVLILYKEVSKYERFDWRHGSWRE